MELGIMQGRLLPRPYPNLQAFPHTNWRDEFKLISEVGLHCIEWIFEYERYEENPVWTASGRREINQLINKTGIKVPSLCADYFLAKPLHHDKSGSLEILKELIPKASEIGVSLILLPVLEEAEIRSEDELKLLVSLVEECYEVLKENNVRIGLEMEISAPKYMETVRAFNSEFVGAYYDTGNSASKGFDMKEDLEVLLPVLFGVHLKDRFVNGISTYIGKGDTNFKGGLPFLKENNYQGRIIIQSFYENEPIETMRRNIEVINGFMEGTRL